MGAKRSADPWLNRWLKRGSDSRAHSRAKPSSSGIPDVLSRENIPSRTVGSTRRMLSCPIRTAAIPIESKDWPLNAASRAFLRHPIIPASRRVNVWGVQVHPKLRTANFRCLHTQHADGLNYSEASWVVRPHPSIEVGDVVACRSEIVSGCDELGLSTSTGQVWSWPNRH